MILRTSFKSLNLSFDYISNKKDQFNRPFLIVLVELLNQFTQISKICIKMSAVFKTSYFRYLIKIRVIN